MKTETLSKSCVGCGYCCKKAPCALAVRVFGATKSCPVLIWDEEKKRYWCDASRKSGEVGARYRAELYIGEGCCSPLNTDRNNIPAPEKPVTNILSRDVQVLLSALGREWISSDTIYLILYRCNKELGEEWTKAANHLIQEQRDSKVKDFMG